MKPRLFISAVTAELGHTRQLVANVLSRLGYDPVWQDIFGTEPGDLRQVLRDKIDGCDGLIQIVGRGYGAEPPTVDPEFGRASYTQFEFLYAQSRGKKTWLIFADDGCTRDRPLEQLDLPHDGEPGGVSPRSLFEHDTRLRGLTPPGSPELDRTAYQAERRALQEAWRQRWRHQQSHLHHVAASDTELELKLERLKDEFADLRRQFRSWQQNVTRNLVAALVLLAAVAGGVWWTIFRLPGQIVEGVGAKVEQTIEEQLAGVRPELIRVQLEKSIKETYQRELAEADTLKDWRKREEARKYAAESRDQRLAKVDDFLQSITSTIQAGDASPEFLELTRILAEQGVEEALAYIETQKTPLLERAAAVIAGPQRELRRTLAPLLQAIQLHRTRGEFQRAHELGEKLLLADYNWPEAHHEFWVTEIGLGDRALRFETLRAATARYESAQRSAEHLQKLDATNRTWQRVLFVAYERLGNVQIQSGQMSEARRSYEKFLGISQKLAAADPTDAQVQRDLWVAYNKLGDLQHQSGHVIEALRSYENGLEIIEKLAGTDPTDVEAQRFLSISYDHLGDVQLRSKHVTEALQWYERAFEIKQKLVAADPMNAQGQRGLGMSYERLGDVHLQSGHVSEALRLYEKNLDVSQKLAAADPADALYQRDLLSDYMRLGDVQLESGLMTEARRWYEQGLEISQKLASTDPTDAQAQRDLSVSYGKLGDVLLQSGQVTEALGHYQKGLEIRQKLAAADPSDAQAQRDLSNSFNDLGDVQLKSAQVTEARRWYEMGLKIRHDLAEADVTDARAQRQLSESYIKLGDVHLESGQMTEGLRSFEKGMEIRQRLAAEAPTDPRNQFNLAESHVKLATAWQKQKEIGKAIESYGRGLKVLLALKEQNGLAPANEKWIGIVEAAIVECRRLMKESMD